MRAVDIALVVSLSLALTAGAVARTPGTADVSDLEGEWTGNWGSTNGVYDASRDIAVTFDRTGSGVLTFVSPGAPVGRVSCSANQPVESQSATAGIISCTIHRADGMVQGLVGAVVRTDAGVEFAGSYVHFNVPGLLTSMHLIKTPAKLQVIACEDFSAQLSCPLGVQRLNVTDVLYGRDDTTTCPAPPELMRNTACSWPAALTAVQKQCNGQRGCTVSATNQGFGADPCIGTRKFLRITYTCDA